MIEESDKPQRGAVHIEPWGEGDLPLLEKVLGDPAMMEHLGGPESPEKIAERQGRYEPAGSGQFRIVVEATGEAAGWVGYWQRAWRDEEVYEIGWSVIPAFQGRGIAGLAADQAIAIARSERKHPFLPCLPVGRQRPVECDLRQAGLHASRGVRVRVSAGHLHAVQ